MTLTDDDRAGLLFQARDLAKHGSRMAWLLCEMADELAKKDDAIAMRESMIAELQRMVRKLEDAKA